MGKLKKFIAKAVLCLSALSSFVPNSGVRAMWNNGKALTKEQQIEFTTLMQKAANNYVKNNSEFIHKQMLGNGSGTPELDRWQRDLEEEKITWAEAMKRAAVRFVMATKENSDPTEIDCKIGAAMALRILNNRGCSCAYIHIFSGDAWHDLVLYKGYDTKINQIKWMCFDTIPCLFNVGQRKWPGGKRVIPDGIVLDLDWLRTVMGEINEDELRWLENKQLGPLLFYDEDGEGPSQPFGSENPYTFRPLTNEICKKYNIPLDPEGLIKSKTVKIETIFSQLLKLGKK